MVSILFSDDLATNLQNLTLKDMHEINKRNIKNSDKNAKEWYNKNSNELYPKIKKYIKNYTEEQKKIIKKNCTIFKNKLVDYCKENNLDCKDASKKIKTLKDYKDLVIECFLNKKIVRFLRVNINKNWCIKLANEFAINNNTSLVDFNKGFLVLNADNYVGGSFLHPIDFNLKKVISVLKNAYIIENCAICTDKADKSIHCHECLQTICHNCNLKLIKEYLKKKLEEALKKNNGLNFNIEEEKNKKEWICPFCRKINGIDFNIEEEKNILKID
jgi:hypothetical protein